MRRGMLHTCLATVVVSGALATVATTPVTAADGGDAVGTALGLPSDVTASVTGPEGSSMVTGSSFGDFPRRSPAGAAAGDVHGQDGQYLVLSTGRASDLLSTTGAGAQPSTDLAGEDVATLTLDVAAADARRCLVLDLAMVTEERVHTYTAETPSDTVSVRRAGDDTEYALQGGPQLFAQGTTRPKPVPFQVNTIDYWHDPGDEADRAVGSSKDSWMPKGTTPFDHATLPETIEVPLPAGADQSVNVSVADVGNQRLDSAALVDHVRLLPRCSSDPGLDTGLFVGAMTIRGDRGVGNSLTLDPVAATTDIERYDALDNGWFAADARGVELRFRWYRFMDIGDGTKCESTDISKWIPIPDADRQTYVPTVKDRRRCLIVLVTGRKDGWRTETFPSPETSWNPTLEIGDGQFVDTYQPQVLDKESSTAPTSIANGQQLTAETRDFAPLQDHFTYQWLADGFTIAGAEGKDFTVTEAQAGKRISVRVTAQRLYFDPMPSESERTAPVDLLTMTTTPVPAITGTPTVGSALGYDMPPWEPTGVSFSRRWYVDDVVQSTTGSTFTLKPEHAGKQVTVAVTGNRSGYQPVTRTSAPVTVGAAPMQPGSPVVSGTPKVGMTLRGSVSSWSPAGATYTYTWTAGSVVLQTGNDVAARTLEVPAAAAGRTVVLTVEAAKDGYVTTSRSSAPTAVVARGTLTSSTPRISGRAKVGQTLRVSTTAWRPAPVRLTYRWYANGRAIAGATRTSYRVPSAARGKRITVKVTGTRSGYTTVTRTSSATARVAR